VGRGGAYEVGSLKSEAEAAAGAEAVAGAAGLLGPPTGGIKSEIKERR
jgi:hypothetical protein